MFLPEICTSGEFLKSPLFESGLILDASPKHKQVLGPFSHLFGKSLMFMFLRVLTWENGVVTIPSQNRFFSLGWVAISKIFPMWHQLISIPKKCNIPNFTLKDTKRSESDLMVIFFGGPRHPLS